MRVSRRCGMALRSAAVLALLCVPLGCADAKVVARGANDIARDLCALHYAERAGLSLDDAAKTFCRDIRPWLDLVLRAQRNGAGSEGCDK